MDTGVMRERLTDEDELYRRGLSSITCRPGAGQTSTVPETRNHVRFGTTRTEARAAGPPNCNAGLRIVQQNETLDDWIGSWL